jgi:hypothetical protein
MGVRCWVVGRLGLTLLAGMGGLAGEGLAQGAMSPGGPAMAPRIAPPPQAPTMAPAPQVPTVAPAPQIPTVGPPPFVSLPTSPAGTPQPSKNESSGERKIPAGGGAPVVLGSGFKGVSGVAVHFGSPTGTRQAVSDANGVVSLGRLPEGVHELTVSTRGAGTSAGPTPPALLAVILIPVFAQAKLVTHTLPSGKDVHITLGANAKGEVTSINWGDGTPSINVAVGDFNGDGRADLKPFQDLAKTGAPGETRIAFQTSSLPNTVNGSASPTRTIPSGQTAPFTATLSNVGVTATGPGGVFQLPTNGQGTAWLGKLGIGNTILDINRADLASALKTAGGPGNPTPHETATELLVVVLIITGWLQAEPVVFAGSWPASALPNTLRADLRVGTNGNLMAVNWGKGPQAPQSLNTYSGATSVNQGLAKTLQDIARQGKPGDVAVVTGTVTKDAWKN